MNNKETGGPAFPFNKRPEQAFPSTFKSLDGKEHIHAWGMTLRDYFAAKAMQGDWADGAVDLNGYSVKAEEYYLMADAMMKARGA